MKIVIVLALFQTANVFAASPSGKDLYVSKTCITCHGQDAKKPILPTYPKLAGQYKEYLLQQMKDIKAGVRTNGNTAAMKAIMPLVTEDEMNALADYLSALKP